MKLKYRFEKMELDDEIVAVPVGDNATELHAVLNLNEVAMRILELLSEETTEQIIVAKLMEEYASDKDKVEQAVHAFIEQLHQEGLLDEE